MKNILRLFCVIGTVSLSVFLAGCSGNPTLASPPTKESLEPIKFQPLSDIPVPSGSKLDTETSLILGGPEHWVGRAVLKTSLAMDEATVFYQNQMPSFGWELITVSQGKATYMTFTRADRVASMQIEGKAFGGSMVTILMSPRQPKPEPPKAK